MIPNEVRDDAGGLLILASKNFQPGFIKILFLETSGYKFKLLEYIHIIIPKLFHIIIGNDNFATLQVLDKSYRLIPSYITSHIVKIMYARVLVMKSTRCNHITSGGESDNNR